MFAAAFPTLTPPLPPARFPPPVVSQPLLYYPPFSLTALAALLSTIAFLCHFTLVSTLIKARKAEALAARHNGHFDSNWGITFPALSGLIEGREILIMMYDISWVRRNKHCL